MPARIAGTALEQNTLVCVSRTIGLADENATLRTALRGAPAGKSKNTLSATGDSQIILT